LAQKKHGILPPRREPSGRLQRPKQRRVSETAQVISIALNQPHRRGRELPADWKLSTHVGRLIADGRVKVKRGDGSEIAPHVLYDAANRFLGAFRGEQWARSSKRPFVGTTPASTRMHVAVYVPDEGELVEPNPAKRFYATEEDERIAMCRSIDQWAIVSRVVRDCGERVNDAMIKAIIDGDTAQEDWIIPFWIVYSLPAGLAALVDYYGLDD
jgi:hypothetical protein